MKTNFFNIEDKIYKHILLEFSKSSSLSDFLITEDKFVILEKHGIIPHINEYWDILRYTLYNMKPDENNNYIITHNIFSEIENCPFSGVFIKIHVNHVKNGKTIINGGYIPYPLKINDNGKIFFAININITTSGFFETEIGPLFKHELTHAYEDYCRLKNNRDGLSNHIMKTNYFNIDRTLKDVDNTYKTMISNICYLFSNTESNAYVATLKGEIDSYIESCHNTNDVFNLLKSTYTWKKIVETENYINKLININDNLEQYIILKEWQETTGENIKSFNALKRILKNKYMKRCNHMINQISKLLFDIYMENGVKYIN